jgi:hypothetical protein
MKTGESIVKKTLAGVLAGFIFSFPMSRGCRRGKSWANISSEIFSGDFSQEERSFSFLKAAGGKR